MTHLLVSDSDRRFAASRLGSVFGSPNARGRGPLSLHPGVRGDAPTDQWEELTVILSGICGSDLGLLTGQASAYFEPWVSLPFVPGHEVLARRKDGARVVIDPVLGHRARGLEPPDPAMCAADGHDYSHLVAGDLDPGIQSGFCCSAGGGWSTTMWAHPSQLHAVPDDLSDEQAVLIEPVAGATHAAAIGLRDRPTHPLIGVIGLGTIGVATVAAIRHFAPGATIIAAGRYPHQVSAARRAGADTVVSTEDYARAVRRATGSSMIGPDLGGGADSSLDCVGTADTLRLAVGTTRPRGRVVAVGMPGATTIDLAPLWHRECELTGAYTYGTETIDGERRHTFAHAIDIIRQHGDPWLFSESYPLARHHDAIAHAASAGARGSFKIAFDPRKDS